MLTESDHTVAPARVRVSVTGRAVVSAGRRSTAASATPGCRVNPVNATGFGPARVTLTPVTSGIIIVGFAVERTEKVQPLPGATHSTPATEFTVSPPRVAVTGVPVCAVPSTVTVGLTATPGASRVTGIDTAAVAPVPGTGNVPVAGSAVKP